MSAAALAVVAAGGAVGACLRYVAALAAQRRAAGRASSSLHLRGEPATPHVPWATLGVNLVGSFALGWLVSSTPDPNSLWRVALGVGVCGALTTYSTFALEVWILLRERRGLALGYVALAVLGGLACAGAGLFLGSLR